VPAQQVCSSSGLMNSRLKQQAVIQFLFTCDLQVGLVDYPEDDDDDNEDQENGVSTQSTISDDNEREEPSSKRPRLT